MMPDKKGSRDTKPLLRRPRQSRRPLPSSCVPEGRNIDQTGDEFIFVDSPIEYEFVNQDDDEDEDRTEVELYHDLYQPMDSRKSHKSCKRNVSAFEKKLVLESSLPTRNSHVKPRLPRGPSNFPCRPLHRMGNLLYDLLWDEDDLDYQTVPAFTLNDFLYQVATYGRLPLKKVRQAMLSRHNYKKLTKILAEQNRERCDKVASIDFSEQLYSIPAVMSKAPHRHLLFEMAAMVKDQINNALNTEVNAVIKPLPKYAAPYFPGEGPLTEIVIYESGDGSDHSVRKSTMTFRDSAMPNSYSVAESLLLSTTPRHFQGAERSQSPFVGNEATDLSLAEMSLLESLAKGGSALSLKAQFLSSMPDISPVSLTLTYLNLSFNDFKIFPLEVLSLRQLTVLKMRNNPLHEVPEDIRVLTNLRTFVVSFCMLSTVPASLFTLTSLIHLDVSYNRLSFLPNEIKKAKSLQAVNVEGNQLYAMPCGALKLRHLKSVRVTNNFMHPLFWREAAKNEPQRLVDIAAWTIDRCGLLEEIRSKMDNKYKTLLSSHGPCDCCGGALYGPGIRIIRPCSKIFGVRNLPFQFVSCSPNCADDFMRNPDKMAKVIYG